MSILNPNTDKIKEVYSTVPNYCGIYEVSTYGNIRSLDRTINSTQDRTYKVKGKQLKLQHDKNGYQMVTLYSNGKNKSQKIHKLMQRAFPNYFNPIFGTTIDHIDGNPSNNYILNLRCCKTKENTRNTKKRKNTSSRFKGVCYDYSRSKWICHITVDYKSIYLGRYINEIDAATAYNKAAKKYHKNFARINVI